MIIGRTENNKNEDNNLYMSLKICKNNLQYNQI